LTTETVTSIIDINVAFDYDDHRALPPFTTRLGIATSYPLYSVAGNDIAIFPCVNALQRWTEIQVKSVRVELTNSRNVGSVIGVVRKGSTNIQ